MYGAPLSGRGGRSLTVGGCCEGVWWRGLGGAAKRSAVSTGKLSASLHVHARPIDLVVCQEPSLFAGDLI